MNSDLFGTWSGTLGSSPDPGTCAISRGKKSEAGLFSFLGSLAPEPHCPMTPRKKKGRSKERPILTCLFGLTFLRWPAVFRLVYFVGGVSISMTWSRLKLAAF
jgi:hypothetical protein